MARKKKKWYRVWIAQVNATMHDVMATDAEQAARLAQKEWMSEGYGSPYVEDFIEMDEEDDYDAKPE